MAKPLSWLAGAGLGAGLMYLCDPERGHRQRAALRDQARHSMGKANKAAMLAARDAANRFYGNLAEAASSMWRKQVSDEVLEERVRSKLGRYVSQPSSVRVAARRGRVTLSGRILRNELDHFVSAVQSIHGVQSVENELDALDGSGGSSGQAGADRSGQHSHHAHHQWSPRARWAAGTAGAALVANSLARRSPWAVLLGTCGLGLCARAATNRNGRSLLGLTDEAGGIRMQKSITIDAPVEQVFELFSDPQNLPKLSSTVKSVRPLGGSRYEKTVAGPAGRDVVITETITRCEPNEHLAWESSPASAVRYHGCAQFASHGNRQTQVSVSLTYHPPGGLLSHAAARLFGADPKARMSDILNRAKTYLETGRQPHDSADQSPISVG